MNASHDVHDVQMPRQAWAIHAGALVCAVGFVAHAMWRVLPWERFALSLVLAAIAFAASWPSRRWMHSSLAGSVAIVWLVALAGLAGVPAVLAALRRGVRELSAAGVARIYPHYVPERLLLRAIPAGDDGLVLSTEPTRSTVAELAGRGRVVLDHDDPTLAAARHAAETDATGAGWVALFERSRARWLLVMPERASPALRAALRRASTVRVHALEDVELWRLADPASAAPSLSH